MASISLIEPESLIEPRSGEEPARARGFDDAGALAQASRGKVSSDHLCIVCAAQLASRRLRGQLA